MSRGMLPAEKEESFAEISALSGGGFSLLDGDRHKSGIRSDPFSDRARPCRRGRIPWTVMRAGPRLIHKLRGLSTVRSDIRDPATKLLGLSLYDPLGQDPHEAEYHVEIEPARNRTVEEDRN